MLLLALCWQEGQLLGVSPASVSEQPSAAELLAKQWLGRELCAAACVSAFLLWGCAACGSAGKSRVMRGPCSRETLSWEAVLVGRLGTGCSERQEGAAGLQQKAGLSPVH